MGNKEYHKIEEVFAFLNWIPPIGGMESVANMEYIFTVIYNRINGINIELTRKEFYVFWSAFKDEILLSFLLDGEQMKLNERLSKGFDFRGNKIRIASS